MFLKKLSVDTKINDLPVPLRGKTGATFKFEMGRCILLHISKVRSFQGEKFDESNFVMRRLLKE